MATRKSQRSKRRRLSESSRLTVTGDVRCLYEKASEDDRRIWGGWCEIESEPSFFNVMLHDMGVTGVKVQEVVSLDHDVLSALPRPVFGLVFLFQWKEEERTKIQESDQYDIWFANQTVDNACATLAIMNIINNVPSLDLGEHLQQFKDFSQDLSPSLRGDTLANFEFLRCVHNSFARRMDILNADLLMKGSATTSTQRRRKRKHEELDAGLHFNAFVPTRGRLWKLDGLEPEPQCLGPLSDDWLENVRADLTARMGEYREDQMEFVVLGLVQDPVLDLKAKLAENVKHLLALQTRLNILIRTQPQHSGIELNDKEVPSEVDSSTLLGPSSEYCLTQQDIDSATPTEVTDTNVVEHGIESLLNYRNQLIHSQAEHRYSLAKELLSQRLDEEKATNRRHDYGPALQAWLASLCRVGLVQELLD